MREPQSQTEPFSSLLERLVFASSISLAPTPLLHVALTSGFLLAAVLVPFIGGLSWVFVVGLYWALITHAGNRRRLSGELAIRAHLVAWGTLGLACLVALIVGTGGRLLPVLVLALALLAIATNLGEFKRQKLITNATKLARLGQGGEAVQVIAPLLPGWDHSDEGRTELEALIVLISRTDAPEFWVTLNRQLESLQRKARKAEADSQGHRQDEAHKHGYGCHCCDGDLDKTKCPVCGLTACWNCGDWQRWLVPRMGIPGPADEGGLRPQDEQIGWQEEPIRIHKDCLPRFRAIETERRLLAARGELR